MLSVIIPARNEPYLENTIEDILANAETEIEIIAVLDGYWPRSWKDNPKVTLLHQPRSGMRACINAGVRIAKGEYLLKCDAHCSFEKGFDTKLIKDCKEDWVMVPRRYNLLVETWTKGTDLHEFQYIEKGSLKGRPWDWKFKGSLAPLMTTQGSCWFMRRSWFEKIGGVDDVNFGWSGREAQEICLKTWFSGGSCVLTRKTWYAHWDKPKEFVVMKERERRKSIAYAQKIWTEEKIRPVIERFAPVPSWEEQLQSRAGLYQKFAKKGFKVGCEIGVYKGFNARTMLDNIPGLKLYLIDPMKDYEGGRIQRGVERFNELRVNIEKNVGGRNTEFLEMKSEEAITKIPDNSIDFVYIDGNHTYDYVMLDILLWSRKVRKGGVISGHDYYNDPVHFCGVKSAVDDYVRQHGLKLNVTEKIREVHTRSAVRSWWWEK